GVVEPGPVHRDPGDVVLHLVKDGLFRFIDDVRLLRLDEIVAHAGSSTSDWLSALSSTSASTATAPWPSGRTNSGLISTSRKASPPASTASPSAAMALAAAATSAFGAPR